MFVIVSVKHIDMHHHFLMIKEVLDIELFAKNEVRMSLAIDSAINPF